MLKEIPATTELVQGSEENKAKQNFILSALVVDDKWENRHSEEV